MADIRVFVVGRVSVDTNNMAGFKYDSSCSYSKSGDCASCCELALVLTP